MILLKSPAKINLSLKVTKKREDGYHNLEMTLSPINIYDQISLSKNHKNKIIVISKPFGPQNENNLAFSAAKYFLEKTKKNQGVTINIKKIIPMGSGLGGSSSNAASVLIGLEKLFKKTIKPYDYKEIAFKLGADVPFFLEAKTSFVQGIGEKISPIPLNDKIYIIIIYPGFSFSTKEVFFNFDKYSNSLELTEKISNDNYSDLSVRKMSSNYDRHFFRNDLQDVANLMNKRVGMYIDLLLANGATKALMTGSGSSVYGIFENRIKQGKAFGGIRKIIYSSSEKNLVEENSASIKMFLAQTIA